MTVYATLGTTFNLAPQIFQIILDSFENERVNLIMTVGRSMDPSQFGSQPKHIHIERYIPQSLLLPHCDAVIFHGGFNSLLSAIVHGLPVVVVPQAAGDHLPNGRRVQEMNAGILVEGKPPNPTDIREAVRAILADPLYRNGVVALREELHSTLSNCKL